MRAKGVAELSTNPPAPVSAALRASNSSDRDYIMMTLATERGIGEA
jgi:hypothetical protein